METYSVVTDLELRDNVTGGLARPRDAMGRFQRQSDSARASLAALSRQKANVTVSANTSAASRALSQLRQMASALVSKPFQIVIGVKNQAGRAIQSVGRSAAGAAGGLLSHLTSPMGMVAAGAGAIGAAAGGLAWPLKLAGDMEQAQIGFETMLGSAEKAKSFLADLTDFANKTPFEFPELRMGAQRLLAVGFAAKDVIPTLTGIGNAASALGVGTEGINRVVTAFGQMQAKGRVQSEELMQLQELGVPALQMLTAGFQREGESIRDTAHMQELITAGAVPARRAIRLLTEEMNRKFPNMMEKQSASLLGLWSTMKDTFNTRVVMRWGQGLASAVQPRLQSLVTWLGSNDKAVTSFGDGLQGLGKQAGEGVMSVVEQLVRAGGELFASKEWQDAPGLLAKLGVVGGRAFGWLLDRMGPVGVNIRWFMDTGWPGLVASGQAAWAWYTGTYLPMLGRVADAMGLNGDSAGAAIKWWTDTGWPGLTAAGGLARDAFEFIRGQAVDLHAELSKQDVYTDLLATWGNVKQIGGDLIGIALDLAAAFGREAAPGAKALTDELGGQKHQAVKDMAADIKDITAGLRDMTKAIRDTIHWVRSLGEWWGEYGDLIKGGALMGTNPIAGSQLIAGWYGKNMAKINAADAKRPENNTPRNDVAYSGAPGSPAEEAAIKRGLAMVGQSSMSINGNLEGVANACERFVQHLFSATGSSAGQPGTNTAMQAAAKFMTDPVGDKATAGQRAEALANAQRGALLYFNNTADTGGAGHAALSLGGGAFLSSTAEGVRVIKAGDPLYSYYERYFMGSGRATYGEAAGETRLPGAGSARGYAGGGWINEPVSGRGQWSGARYTFAEDRAEYVNNGRGMPAAGGMGRAGGGAATTYAPVQVNAPISLSFPNATTVDRQAIEEAIAAAGDHLANVLADGLMEAGANTPE